MKSAYKNYFVNLFCPAFLFASITGVMTSVVVTLYKFCAHHAIGAAEVGYHYMRSHPTYAFAALLLLFAIAWIFSYVYRIDPNLRGGGISTSVGILRGIFRFNWLRSLVGIFFMSLVSFVTGVPLGNEGPSVQMGTALGRASLFSFHKKHRAWDRYCMTGGACAGFSVATGAPISGIIFAIEEAHQRISPMIVLVASVSVMFARITTELIAPLFGVGVSMFPRLELPTLTVRDIWLPITVGVAGGLFAVVFLKVYKLLGSFYNRTLGKVPGVIKIFAVFALTLVFGLFAGFESISTGHELIIGLFNDAGGLFHALSAMLIILAVRTLLTLSANANGITGGVFIPLMALGALMAAIVAKIGVYVLGIDGGYYTTVIVFGITACIAGMMKMPLTAIFFTLEGLSEHDNILAVIIVATLAYVITEIFDVKSINDSVVEQRIEALAEEGDAKVVDKTVTVMPGSFAAGKQIRDIFWPCNLFVLSVRHGGSSHADVDEHGGSALREGDVLQVRYATYDESATLEELYAIVGEAAD